MTLRNQEQIAQTNQELETVLLSLDAIYVEVSDYSDAFIPTSILEFIDSPDKELFLLNLKFPILAQMAKETNTPIRLLSIFGDYVNTLKTVNFSQINSVGSRSSYTMNSHFLADGGIEFKNGKYRLSKSGVEAINTVYSIELSDTEKKLVDDLKVITSYINGLGLAYQSVVRLPGVRRYNDKYETDTNELINIISRKRYSES